MVLNQKSTTVSSYSSYQPTASTNYYTSGYSAPPPPSHQVPVRDLGAPRYSSTSPTNLVNTGHQKSGNVSSYSLGFKLDEQAFASKHIYVVKFVETGTPSAMAGLKEGDKITKINGRSTVGMPYDEFHREILIAQQQQMRNNMIHLMVMRKSAKSTGTGLYSAATSAAHTSSSSSSMMMSPPIVSSSKYQQHQSSGGYQSGGNVVTTTSYVDEGYGPGSATSSTATGIGPSTSSSGGNLISVVKINQYGKHTHTHTHITHPTTSSLSFFFCFYLLLYSPKLD